MRVPQLGGDVEPEVGRVFNGVVPELDAPHPSLLEGLLEKEGLKGGVQLLGHILQQYWRPELDAILKCSHVIRVSQFDHLQSTKYRVQSTQQEGMYMYVRMCVRESTGILVILVCANFSHNAIFGNFELWQFLFIC